MSNEQLLRTVNQHNSDLNSAVLEIRIGLVRNYDTLSERGKRLEKDFGDLCGLSDENELRVSFAELQKLVQQKLLLINDFKADHSIVKNSMAAFQHYFQKSLDKFIHEEELGSRLADLGSTGFRYLDSGRIDDQRSFNRAINSLSEKTQSHKIRDPDTKRAVELLLRHSRNLLNRRNQLDQTIDRLIQVPVHESVQKLLLGENLKFESKSKAASIYTWLLAATVLNLAFFCVYQFTQVMKSRSQLLTLNSNLDNLVDARTRELKKSSEQLKQKSKEAEVMALAARFTDNAVIITDREGVIQWVNDGFTQITGYQADEAIGKNSSILHGPETGKKQLEIKEHSMRNGEPFDFTTAKYKKNGDLFWAEVEGRPIHESHFENHRFVLMERDITDRVEAKIKNDELQAELLTASRQAGMAEIATGVLHNVGNILNSVNVSAYAIKTQFSNSAFSNLKTVVELIKEHESSLENFITSDKRGQQIPAALEMVTSVIEG